MNRLFFTLLLTGLFTNATAGDHPAEKITKEKILRVAVDDIGIISIGNDTISSDDLARYIQERLFKSYMGTGRMHSKIKLVRLNKNVSETVVQVVLKEIRSGQNRALTELCIQKYKDRYENLDPRRQQKLKKIFPVLFQAKFQ